MVRCIQIGLICVQEHPKDRPAIEIMFSMLSRDIVELPEPKQPVFAENGSTPGPNGSTQQNVYPNNERSRVHYNGTNRTIWSTNLTTTSPVLNPVIQILDTGNLVLWEEASGNTLWESFSHPTDVMMQAMTLSQNVKTGEQVRLTSWKYATDPSIGSFTGGLDAMSGAPQLVTWDEERPHWRSGPWNGLIFIGIKIMFSAYLDGFNQVKNDSDGNFFYSTPQINGFITVELNSSGTLLRKVWDGVAKRWNVEWTAPENECDVYGNCGAFGSCNGLELPICSCLRGFEPVNEEEWGRGNWTNGCRRKRQLQCGDDGFERLRYMKVPDFAQPLPSRVQDECRTACQRNCSCIAYAYDINIGCMFWSDNLIDTQEFDRVGIDLYVRLSASEFDSHKERKLYIIVAVVVGFVCISVMMFIAWWLMKRKGRKAQDSSILEAGQMFTTDSTAIVLKNETREVNIGDLPKFTFEMLANATNQFHEDNLLGRGGFGPVYKGVLANEKEIAVKRLSAESGQGMQEFMNEVIVISKLQHRNLVKLLGGCVEKEEKILIYEYMPNKSLDACLFGSMNSTKKLLDWNMRYSIIEGIGRGILYLHRDSRLRIIHRDLKPSNVLLDQDWNPKISDFGMARIFGGNEDHGSTARVVGTYGYMAPEYGMEGRFSEKSDVFSFGVLILEIVKGEKNTHYFNDELSLGLIGCAWKMWNEGNSLSFVEESIASRETEEEMVRCIQIGLLCVQESPNDRPLIQTVLSMLSGEILNLPVPKQPVFAENGSNSAPNGSTQQYVFSITSSLLVRLMEDDSYPRSLYYPLLIYTILFS
ncbi:G-type lectin S-receptor-like serine/threonine-protein kinase At1g11300 [Salvia hispanica]|uniref:G-type lectin S-receptor-like serine/threonine-protein kinase At1g11300 n=1 Tax=Salvia hispanica TaxID=49212 RepID=UPI002008F333|nr:G-type lectin S-receptor-like serine/threonine-protein kinase At1g11300 [Salvia hispanica]